LTFQEYLKTCGSPDIVLLCILGKALETAIFVSKLEGFKKEIEMFRKYQKNFNSFLIKDDFDSIQVNIEGICFLR
jgi:hypothetical protein